MQLKKSPKPIRISAKTIKMRPYTLVKLTKRLEPLAGVSTVVIQVKGSKEFVVTIGPRKTYYEGISIKGGEALHLPIGVDHFRELYLYANIDHPDYRINFDLTGKAFRDHLKEHDRFTEEAKKTMWIYIAVMQIVN